MTADIVMAAGSDAMSLGRDERAPLVLGLQHAGGAQSSIKGMRLAVCKPNTTNTNTQRTAVQHNQPAAHRQHRYYNQRRHHTGSCSTERQRHPPSLPPNLSPHRHRQPTTDKRWAP